MKLPEDSVIATEKITHYLLKWQPDNDKSEFLKRAGYTPEKWEYLIRDIRSQLRGEAEFSRKTAYGNLYKIQGSITGPNGISLEIVTIWMTEHKSEKTKFITLFPDKEI